MPPARLGRGDYAAEVFGRGEAFLDTVPMAVRLAVLAGTMTVEDAERAASSVIIDPHAVHAAAMGRRPGE